MLSNTKTWLNLVTPQSCFLCISVTSISSSYSHIDMNHSMYYPCMSRNSYKGRNKGWFLTIIPQQFRAGHHCTIDVCLFQKSKLNASSWKKNPYFNGMTCFLRVRIPGIRMSQFYSPYFTKVSISLLVGLGQLQVKLQFKSIFHVQKCTYHENSLVIRWT